MLTRRPIRDRLLIVAALGVFTAALSAAALYRAILTTTAQRVERARDTIIEELARMQTAGSSTTPEAEANVTATWVIGLRGGLAADAAEIARAVPEDWRAPLLELAARARADGRPVDFDGAMSSDHLVARIAPIFSAAGPRLVWGAVMVRPSPRLQSWRTLVVALTVSALLLVVAAGSALLTMKRGAGALQSAVQALAQAQDLSAPLPRSSVRELGDIADGIALLAQRLVEARQIQERLGRDLARQERLVALGRVVAGVAHEVRNPLASIKLRLDLAATGGGQLSQAARDAITHASSEIARLDRLVADLLIVSGRPLGPRRAIDAAALLAARAEALGPWAALRGISIDVVDHGGNQAARSIAETDADADGLARAIDNLLRNAVEASPHGATVEAAVVAGTGDRLEIHVDDQGTGVPSGRAGELFEPFFTTKPEGTGLGLAISRAIARAHGGDLVYARAGGVTRFLLSLPRASGAVAAVTANGGANGSGGAVAGRAHADAHADGEQTGVDEQREGRAAPVRKAAPL